MEGDVVFDGEKEPARASRAELIMPGPKKGNSDKIVLGLLGTVLLASVFIAFKTSPKQVVLLTPMDAPLVNPPRQ